MNSVKMAIAQLRRRCHAMLTELETAADTLSGDELVTKVETIMEKYGAAA